MIYVEWRDMMQNGQELPKMDQNAQNGAKRPKKSHPKINAKSALKLKSICKSKIVKIIEKSCKITKFGKIGKSVKIIKIIKNRENLGNKQNDVIAKIMKNVDGQILENSAMKYDQLLL